MPGGAAGLQNQSGGCKVPGGFDSLPSPPEAESLLNQAVAIFTVRSSCHACKKRSEWVGKVLRRMRSQQVMISERADVRVPSTAIS